MPRKKLHGGFHKGALVLVNDDERFGINSQYNGLRGEVLSDGPVDQSVIDSEMPGHFGTYYYVQLSSCCIIICESKLTLCRYFTRSSTDSHGSRT